MMFKVVKAPVPCVVTPMVEKLPATGVVIPIVVLLIVPPVIVAPDELRVLAVVGPLSVTAPVPVEKV